MSTHRKRSGVGVSRRALLRGLGVGVGMSPFIPLLNVSGQEVRRPKRLLLIYTPDGTPDSDGPAGPLDWKPQGTETAFTLHAIHAPLDPIKSKIVVPWGMKASAKGAGEQHAYGMAGLFTGALLHDPQNGADFDGGNGHRTGWGSGPSIDQAVAAFAGEGAPYLRAPTDPVQETPYRTIELGVQVGQPHSVYRMIYKGDEQPLHPETSPLNAFNRLFGMVTGDAAALARKKAEQTAILDLVKGDLGRLKTRVSTEEHPKIDAHVEGLAAIERRLSTTVATCSKPAMPASTRSSNDTFPAETTAMLDLVVHALACDLTRVASVQLSHGFSNVVHTWLGQSTAHHTMSHDATVDRRPDLQAIDAWYSQQVFDLLTKMAAIDEGNGTTLLDNTLVAWGRELGSTSHAMRPMPFLLAGGSQAGLRTGRFLDVSGMPHAQILVSIGQMMGMNITTFGNIDVNSGPLAKLA